MRRIGSRRIVFALALSLLLGAAARAADSAAPERLLAADSVLYWRFDGWDPHQAAYDKTAFAEVMRGDLGRFVDYLRQLFMQELGGGKVRDSLLAGKSPEELLKLQTAAKQLPAMWEMFRKNGIVVGVEVEAGPPPTGRATVVFPRAKSLFPVLQILAGLTDGDVKEQKVKDRPALVAENKGEKVIGVAWAEGEDLVICFGTGTPDQIVERVVSRGEHNLIGNPILKRLAEFKEYETLSHGFVDIERIIGFVAKQPDGDKVQKIVAALGLGNVRQLTWYDGYEGRHQRSTFEILMPGERKGLLRMLAGRADFSVADLLPLPPDATSVHASNLSLGGFYEGFREAMLNVAPILGEDAAKQVREFDDAQREVSKQLGIDIQKDLLDSLGTTMVGYSAPSEGPISLGAGLAIQVVKPDKLGPALDNLGRALLSQAGGKAQIKRHTYHGVELRTLVSSRGGDFTEIAPTFGPFTPTYAIHKGWLVMALNPQTVEGYIMRTEGKYEMWKPSPLFTEVLEHAKQRSPQARLVAISESDPRPTMRFLLSLAPLFGGIAANQAPEKFDNSMIPNTQAVVAPLYPNVSIMTDDGQSLRVDCYKSAPFPLDGGLVTLYFGIAAIGGLASAF